MNFICMHLKSPLHISARSESVARGISLVSEIVVWGCVVPRGVYLLSNTFIISWYVYFYSIIYEILYLLIDFDCYIHYDKRSYNLSKWYSIDHCFIFTICSFNTFGLDHCLILIHLIIVSFLYNLVFWYIYLRVLIFFCADCQRIAREIRNIQKTRTPPWKSRGRIPRNSKEHHLTFLGIVLHVLS